MTIIFFLLQVLRPVLTAVMLKKKKEGNKNIIHYREMFVPYISLRGMLSYKTDLPDREQIVIINSEKYKIRTCG